MEFNKDMKVFDILLQDIRAMDVFKKYGMKCIACNGAHEDTLEMACNTSGISLVDILKDLNDLHEKITQEI